MYDILIIGCGVSGASCAYMLSKYDLKIAVLDKSNDVANGTTKANSAQGIRKLRIPCAGKMGL